MFSRIRCCNLSMTRCRTDTGVLRHAGKAAFAAATAASNSASVVCGTLDTTSCVACGAPNPHVSCRNAIFFLRQYWYSECTISCMRHMHVTHMRTGFVTSIHSSVVDSKNSPLIRVFTLSCNIASGM